MRKLFAIILLMMAVLCDPIQKKNSYYGIIYDAGSTGTRANIFEILKEENAENTIDSQPKQASTPTHYPVKFIKKISCGVVFKVIYDTEDLLSKIDICHNEALKSIPQDIPKKNIWMKFVGTGGLRMLRSDNKDKFNDITNKLEKHFKTTGIHSLCHTSFVEIIDGLNEASLGFISSSYNEGTSTIDPKGSIDIGGSSLQVIMPLKPNDSLPKVFKKKTILVFNHHYDIGATSFDCGGVDNIKNIYYINILKSQPDPLTVKRILSPCHPKDFVSSFTSSSLLNNCTMKLLKNLDLPNTIEFEGTNNGTECQNELVKAFCYNTEALEHEKCILDGDQAKLITLGYPIKINLLGAWNHFASQFDSEDYKTLLEKIDKMISDKSCMNGDIDRCFGATYVKFITQSFIKPEDEIIVKKLSPGWALGKMVIDTGCLTPAYAARKILVGIVIAAFVIIILSGTAVFIYRYSMRRIRRNRVQEDEVLIH